MIYKDANHAWYGRLDKQDQNHKSHIVDRMAPEHMNRGRVSHGKIDAIILSGLEKTNWR